METHFTDQVALGASGPPTTDAATITGLPGTTGWLGGNLAPNGLICFTPRNEDHVLIIDPKANGTLLCGAYLSACPNDAIRREPSRT